MCQPEHDERVFESDKPFSQSILWRWQRDFFEAQGPAAWSRGTVPHYVTSNPFIADAYARVVLAHLEDTVGRASPREPIPIVELGAGSGRFAFYFLQRFSELAQRSPLARLPFVYVLSDFAEATIAGWRRHPQLRTFVEAGQLDFARFDAERSQELILLESGRRLAPGTVTTPMVALANYFFDGLPEDVFFVKGGALAAALVTVRGPEGAGLDGVKLSWSARPIADDYYGDGEIDAILGEYRARLPDTALAFPVAGLRCCHTLRAIAGDQLLVLSADKGWAQEEELVDRAPPSLTNHGSFSLSVNYHALARGFERAGGTALVARRPSSALTVVALTARPAGERIRAAFAEHVERFGPDDFFALKKGLEPRFAELTVAQVLALLRLGHDDPRLFQQCTPALARGLADVSAAEARELCRALARVAARYFHIGDAHDLLPRLGLLLARLGRPVEAIAQLERALAWRGFDVDIALPLAQLHYQLQHATEARRYIDAVLQVAPGSSVARALRLELESSSVSDETCRAPARLQVATG